MAASTGSPASRKSTKLTPLTTRPSLTSRQGITRTLNIRKLLGRGARVTDQRQCCGGIKTSIVKCPACYGSGELFRTRRQQRLHIIDGSKTAGGDDRDRDVFGKPDSGVEIEAS